MLNLHPPSEFLVAKAYRGLLREIHDGLDPGLNLGFKTWVPTQNRHGGRGTPKTKLPVQQKKFT